MRLLTFFAALMVVSVKRIRKPYVEGAQRTTVTEVTMDNAYALNGEPLTPRELGLKRVTDATCIVKNGSEAEAVAVGSVWYDVANQKLRVNDYKTQKEMVEGKDLSKVVVTVTANGS